jgi:2-dehydropantoate 2-reductase
MAKIGIIGAGAIGCHLSHCLCESGSDVYLFCRNQTYENILKNGIRLKIIDKQITENRTNLIDTNNLTDFPELDYLIICTKLYSFNEELIRLIRLSTSENTIIIPPTTGLPHWWFHDTKDNDQFLDNDQIQVCYEIMPPEKCIGMTYWLSSKQLSPGNINVTNIQRGYPIGTINNYNTEKAKKLTELLIKGGIESPFVNDIKGEIFMKSINSLSFNLIAVLTERCNGDMISLKHIFLDLMNELEQISRIEKLILSQSSEERIIQTLNSKFHEMSMLQDYLNDNDLECYSLYETIKNVADIHQIKLPLCDNYLSLIRVKDMTSNKL